MTHARRLTVVVIAASVAMVATVGVLAWRDREPAVDGEFVLEEPGIYSEPVTTSPVTGQPLPDVVLRDASGDEVSLASFAGTPMIVNVWYSSCAPCARELADFAAVAAEHDGHIQFVGVNPTDDVDTMNEFAAARGVEYPLLRDVDQAWVAAMPVTAFPTTLFVSADGRVLHQTNELTADELRAKIAEVF